ncbi:unnamed protein product [Phytophthora fragariaefolia]|uniref:Unnamed protein product n=1 Tax=Phytophthora fragariaefolia TaxID=1490495 RepID=A0A9W6TXH4_9STRA|nr:unnamed protein product [Phytophthora fragariaefolia]
MKTGIKDRAPAIIDDYEESKLGEALVKKDEMKVTITVEQIGEAIIELYFSTRKEIAELDNKEVYVFTQLTGIWQFTWVRLGTHKFRPSYGDRDNGVRRPFLIWMRRALGDFRLTTSNLCGATTNMGSDEMCLLKGELQLPWEWCIAHIAHAQLPLPVE